MMSLDLTIFIPTIMDGVTQSVSYSLLLLAHVSLMTTAVDVRRPFISFYPKKELGINQVVAQEG